MSRVFQIIRCLILLFGIMHVCEPTSASVLSLSCKVTGFMVMKGFDKTDFHPTTILLSVDEQDVKEGLFSVKTIRATGDASYSIGVSNLSGERRDVIDHSNKLIYDIFVRVFRSTDDKRMQKTSEQYIFRLDRTTGLLHYQSTFLDIFSRTEIDGICKKATQVDTKF